MRKDRLATNILAVAVDFSFGSLEENEERVDEDGEKDKDRKCDEAPIVAVV